MIHHHTIEVVQVVSAFVGAMLNFWAGFDSTKDYFYQKKWKGATEDTHRLTRMAVRNECFAILFQLALFTFGVHIIWVEPENFVLPDRAYPSRYTMTFISVGLVIGSAWNRWDREIILENARKGLRRWGDTRH